MFAFLLKLRHPANAVSYIRNLEMLELTLISILGQRTTYPFMIVVVCNEKPHLEIEDSRVHFVVVDFPESGSRAAAAQQQQDCWLDKGAKVAMGLNYLRAYNVSRVFLMDADDWVHRDTVETVMSAPTVKNWHVDRGYLVDFNAQRTVRKRGLVRYCGSTLIFEFIQLLELVGLPEYLAPDTSRDALLAQMGEYSLIYLLGHHRYFLGKFESLGEPMRPLPIPACCWVVNTGENRSGTLGHQHGRGFDHEFLEDFTLRDHFAPAATRTSLLDGLYERLLLLCSSVGWRVVDKSSDKV